MEKRDVAIVVIGLVIVMVMAFVVKPVITGKPVDMRVPIPQVPGLATPSPTPTAAPTIDSGYEEYKRQLASGGVQPTITRTTVPTPVPAWSGQTKGMGFVDPAIYNTTPADQTPLLHGRNISDPVVSVIPLVTYATIKGQHSGTTDKLFMPFPYWELRYTVDPWENTFQATTSNKEAGVADSMGTEVFPSFSIQVIDADHPTQVVRTITPDGGLDATLWKKGTDYDPRPWTEKFYEGPDNKTYFFVITTHMINSYQIDVLVPQNYVGKF